MLLRLMSSKSGCWANDMQIRPVPPPHSGQQPPPHSDQQPPPDLGPSGEAQEEDYDTEQHWGLATKVVEGREYVQNVVVHHPVVVQVVEGMGEVRESLEAKGNLVEAMEGLVDWQEHQEEQGQ